MNIVFVNATQIWGGVKSSILTLGRALVQRGHRVSVVAYPGVFVDVCHQHGLDVLPLRFGFDGNPWVMARLVRWFASHKANWVVTNIEKDIYVAGPAARLAGARVLNQVGAPGEVKVKGRKAVVRAWMSDAFLFPSHFAACQTQAQVPWLRRRRVQVIYNPVDTERFSPRPDRTTTARFHLGITGRLAPIKGHRVLIEALRLLPADVLTRTHVDIAGEGPLEQELKALVAVSQLQEQVGFLGFVTEPERLLRQLDVAVFPSLMDAMPVALLEAMACGLPVVASAVGGIPEIISHGSTGLLVQPDDQRGIAAALTQLGRDPTLRETLGCNARRDIEKRFAVEVIAKQFEALL
ncbi:D-inositol-3-phosphate glycosyltransferase [Candidatus Entotheonellaceae bacterium PAL068K]